MFIEFVDIISKFHFVWISAFELDQTPVNDLRVSFPKMMKNDEKLQFQKNIRKLIFILKFRIECIPMKENQRCDIFDGSALRVPVGNPVDGLPPARHRAIVYR